MGLTKEELAQEKIFRDMKKELCERILVPEEIHMLIDEFPKLCYSDKLAICGDSKALWAMFFFKRLESYGDLSRKTVSKIKDPLSKCKAGEEMIKIIEEYERDHILSAKPEEESPKRKRVKKEDKRKRVKKEDKRKYVKKEDKGKRVKEVSSFSDDFVSSSYENSSSYYSRSKPSSRCSRRPVTYHSLKIKIAQNLDVSSMSILFEVFHDLECFYCHAILAAHPGERGMALLNQLEKVGCFGPDRLEDVKYGIRGYCNNYQDIVQDMNAFQPPNENY
jgi:hypothetical protein